MLRRSLRRIAGIYIIENTVNGRCYIGASARIGVRWREHLYQLRHDYHHNTVLLSDWNLYGEAAFEFILLEELDPANPDWDKEYAWMVRYHTHGRELYNYGYLLGGIR